jgi:hypothetical protein
MYDGAPFTASQQKLARDFWSWAISLLSVRPAELVWNFRLPRTCLRSECFDGLEASRLAPSLAEVGEIARIDLNLADDEALQSELRSLLVSVMPPFIESGGKAACRQSQNGFVIVLVADERLECLRHASPPGMARERA